MNTHTSEYLVTPMKHQLSQITHALNVTDAPDVTGTTSGLRSKTIRPEKITFTASRSSARAVITGYEVNSRGELTQRWSTIKVQLDNDGDMYAKAPTWMRALYAEVTETGRIDNA